MFKGVVAPRTRTLSKAWRRRAEFRASPTFELYADERVLDRREITLLQPDVLVIHRIVVDAAVGRRNPCRHFAGLRDTLHQAQDVCPVAFTGQPTARVRSELFRADGLALGSRWHAGPVSDVAAKARAGQRQTEAMARLLDQSVPSLQSDFAIPYVRAARDFVHRIAHGDLFALRAATSVGQLHLVTLLERDVIFVLCFVRTPLQSIGEV